VNYVIAGYTIALASLFVYAVGLGLRRRRWERALKATEDSERPLSSGQPVSSGRPVAPDGRP
jgi:hypothetical protein